MIPKSEVGKASLADVSVDAQNSKGKGPRVLVVEHGGTRTRTIEARERSTSRLLSRAGYEVHVVGNVCEALGAFYIDSLPAVVVLDRETSVSSGWQFLLGTLASLAPVLAMLEDCQVAAARIQDVAKMLAHLSDHARAQARRAAQTP